jgi:hypothetical protein
LGGGAFLFLKGQVSMKFVHEFAVFLAAGLAYLLILAFSQAFGGVIGTFLKDIHPGENVRKADSKIGACILFGISSLILVVIVGIFGFGGFFFREKAESTITLICLLFLSGTFFAVKGIIDDEKDYLREASVDRFKLAMRIGLFFVFVFTWIQARAIAG